VQLVKNINSGPLARTWVTGESKSAGYLDVGNCHLGNFARRLPANNNLPVVAGVIPINDYFRLPSIEQESTVIRMHGLVKILDSIQTTVHRNAFRRIDIDMTFYFTICWHL
jgi:hypothetical protein